MQFDIAELERMKKLDLEELNLNVGANETLVNMILDSFREDMDDNVKDRIQKIHQALEDGDAKLLRESAHYIKGGALNACAARLAHVASALQAIAESGRLEDAAPLIPILEQEFETVKTALDDLKQG